jgi:hypothetical protein
MVLGAPSPGRANAAARPRRNDGLTIRSYLLMIIGRYLRLTPVYAFVLLYYTQI